MNESQEEPQPRFYICPMCFTAADDRLVCHGHLMVACNAESIEDCRPLIASDGQLQTRAPRWFLKEITRRGR
jgi:hypothetical protein